MNCFKCCDENDENVTAVAFSNHNGHSNGQVKINISSGNEVKKIETTVVKEPPLLVLFKLVRYTRGCDDMNARKEEILAILRANQEICTEHIDKQNIFHCLARNDERNSELLTLFGFGIQSSDSSNPQDPQPFTKFVSEEQLGELLKMPHTTHSHFPIHYAVQYGFTLFVKEMLKIFPALVTQIDGDGCMPLHIAAKSSMPESFECTKELLEVIENENKTVEVFCAKTKETGETPVHLICSKVPSNKSRVAEKLDVMLISAKSQWRNDPYMSGILETYDKKGLSPLHLLCKREREDIQTNNFGDISNRYKLMRKLLEFMDPTGATKLTRDGSGSSVLHLAVESELPILLAFLLRKIDMKMLGCIDKTGKSAIHYAAEQCIRPEAQKCLKLLVDWNTLKERLITPIDHLEPHDYFRQCLLLATVEENVNGLQTKHTALTLACNAKSTQSVDLILKNMYYAKPKINEWFICQTDDQYIYSLKAVYENVPGALEFLFTKSISIDMKRSNENVVEFTADLSVINALHSPVQNEIDLIGTQYLELAENWPQHVQEKLLLHPLTHCALGKVWKSELRPYKILWIFLNIAWIGWHMILIPYSCIQLEQESDAGGVSNTTEDNPTYVDCYQFNSTNETMRDVRYKFKIHEYTAAWMLLISILIYVFTELFVTKCCLQNSYSFTSFVRSLFGRTSDIVQVVLALVIALVPILDSLKLLTNFSPNDVFVYCSAIAIILAGFNMFRNLAVVHLPIGKWIKYIIKGTLEVAILMAIAIPLFIGYLKAYQQIFPKIFKGSVGDWGGFLVMSAGEINYSENYQRESTLTLSGIFKTIFFIVYWVIFPGAFMGLTLGIVYDKIKDMKSRLDMLGMSSHIRLTNYIQRTLVCKIELILGCVNFKGDDAKEVKWFIEWNKEHDGWSAFRCSFWKCCEQDLDGGNKELGMSLCGNGLPKIVKKVIYEMYQEKLREREKRDLEYLHIDQE